MSYGNKEVKREEYDNLAKGGSLACFLVIF